MVMVGEIAHVNDEHAEQSESSEDIEKFDAADVYARWRAGGRFGALRHFEQYGRLWGGQGFRMDLRWNRRTLLDLAGFGLGSRASAHRRVYATWIRMEGRLSGAILERDFRGVSASTSDGIGVPVNWFRTIFEPLCDRSFRSRNVPDMGSNGIE